MYIIGFLSFVTLSAYAAPKCQYVVEKDKTLVEWTAFKTPKKVGVGGKFLNFKIKDVKGKSLADSVKGTTFEIDSQSVSTGNPDRDKKLVTFFFQTKEKPIKISGKFISLNGSEAKAILKINDTSKEIILNLAEVENTAVFTGKINVEDFLLSPNLKSINEACKQLHEGVTWPDVELKITTSYQKKNC